MGEGLDTETAYPPFSLYWAQEAMDPGVSILLRADLSKHGSDGTSPHSTTSNWKWLKFHLQQMKEVGNGNLETNPAGFSGRSDPTTTAE